VGGALWARRAPGGTLIVDPETKSIDKEKRGFGVALGRSVPLRAFLRSKHLIVLMFERASRCYESGTLTRDVFPESFEQRDALGSSDEYSEDVWT
jgi:hypothetical protein